MANAAWNPRALGRGLLLAASLVALGWTAEWLAQAGVVSERWIDIEVAGRGWRGQFSFLVLGALATAVGLPRQVIAFLGGHAFGVLAGAGFALVATILGCIATFAYARLVAKALLTSQYTARARRLEDFLGTAPFQMTLIVRLLPVGSNVVTNLVAGVANVRLGPFLAGSALGYVPQTLAFVLAGSGVHMAATTNVVLGAALLVASGALGIRLYRGLRRGAALEADIDRSLDELPPGDHPHAA